MGVGVLVSVAGGKLDFAGAETAAKPIFKGVCCAGKFGGSPVVFNFSGNCGCAGAEVEGIISGCSNFALGALCVSVAKFVFAGSP